MKARKDRKRKERKCKRKYFKFMSLSGDSPSSPNSLHLLEQSPHFPSISQHTPIWILPLPNYEIIFIKLVHNLAITFNNYFDLKSAASLMANPFFKHACVSFGFHETVFFWFSAFVCGCYFISLLNNPLLHCL